jgi:hypothetical protein
MNGDPRSETDIPAMTPPHRALAEQFASFAEYAEFTAGTPQFASTSLDVARFHAVTGELSFSTDPTVLLYLDGGTVYHAERIGDPSVSQTLTDIGVIEVAQMQRGVVRVGDVEHLGRLFDRDASIDRDAVMVIIESRTNAIVDELANAAVASVSVSAYRHHPSGIHRWFVAPAEPSTSQFPVSGFAQVDRSVVDDIPSLDAPAGMRIEWSEPDPSGLGVPSAEAIHVAPDAHVDIQAELDRFDADQADWTSAADVPDEAVPSPLGEFHIVWPDGTEDAPIVEVPAELTAPPVASASMAPLDALPAPSEAAPLPLPLAPPTMPLESLAAPSAADPVVSGPAAPPVVVQAAFSESGAPAFSLQPLVLDSIPAPDAAVPDDVASAVKRALQAIENASTNQVAVPEIQVASIILPKMTMPVLTDPAPAAPPAPPPVHEVPPAPVAPPAHAPTALGFAPPTLDMRAEAVYERAAAVQADPSAVVEAAVGDAAASHPEPGKASVVFVDDEPEAKRERRGALRRLIGSLRNHD